MPISSGPLDAIRLSGLQREAVSPSIGFCTVTDTGPVQALYRDAGHGLRVMESATRAGAADEVPCKL